MKNFIKIVLFSVVCFCVLNILFNILRLKLDEADTMKIFYEQPRDSVDVLALGSSHVFGSINPALLWEEYGISSFDLCAAGSNTTVSYYYLQEALKTQTPKVVILGINIVTDNIEEFGSEVAYMWTGSMKFSLNKINLIKNITAKDRLDVILGFPISHTRLEELGAKDFLAYKGDEYHKGYKGNRIFWGNIKEEDIFEEHTYNIGSIPEHTKETLDRIIKLSDEHNFKLILYVSPALRSQDEWEAINGIELMAQERDITFLNSYNDNNIIGIDYLNDMNDKEHVNYLGNIKTTKYIGDYLDYHFELPDHRGDRKYSTWDLCLNDYTMALEDFNISQASDLGEFINKISKPYFKTIFFLNNKKYYSALKKEDKKAFDALGFSKDIIENNECFLIENNVIYPIDNKKIFELGRHTIEIDKENNIIFYDRNKLPLISEGISFVTFDTRANSIVTWREYSIDLQNKVIEEYRNDNVLQEIWIKR